MQATTQSDERWLTRRRRRQFALAFMVALLLMWGVLGSVWLRSRHEPPAGAAATPAVPSAGIALPPGAADTPDTIGARRGEGPPPGHEALSGTVRLAGQPVAGVHVTVSGGAAEAISDDAGGFRIEGLRPGRYAVRALGDGAAAFLDGIALPDALGRPPAPLVVDLQPAPALLGRVIDGEGHPLEGADVTLAEGLFAPLPRATHSDGAGAFHFAAVLPGRYLVAAGAPGLVTATTTVGVTTTAPDVELKLDRAAVLAGLVVDEDERPIGGAKISLVRDGASATPLDRGAGPAPLLEPAGELGVVHAPIPYPPLDGPLDGPVALASAAAAAPLRSAITSDARGRFRVEGLRGGRVAVVVSHAAFLDGRSPELDLKPGGETQVQVALRRAMVLRGHVLDGSGQPVPGAELWIDGAVASITDKRGRWELRRVPGAIDLEVRARGHAGAKQHIDPSFRPGAGGEIDFLVGAAEAKLAGVVVDTRGLPVAAARVLVEGADGNKQSTATDTNGEFALAAAPTGPMVVHVSHGEHLHATVAGVELGDDVRVTLAAGGAIEGEIVDERGGLPAAARASIEDASGERHVGIVDRTGRFRIGGCSPGLATLRVEAPGYLAASAVIDLPAADTSGEIVLRDLRVTLAQSGLITGTLRDHYGQPVPSASIEGGGAKARTDGAGRFTLAPVPTGRVEIVARSDKGEAESVAVVERGRAASVDMRLP